MLSWAVHLPRVDPAAAPLRSGTEVTKTTTKRDPVLARGRWLYAAAIFLGAFLLFILEPIVAKQLLPLLGGSSSVWTTCLVFFQCVLLLGYLYAHLLATRLRPRAQAIIHGTLLGISVALIMVHGGVRPLGVAAHPLLSIFSLLSILIGLPYLCLSATSPLLQTWYAQSRVGEINAGRPRTAAYSLFALSNLASMLALVLYPAVVEPNLSLHTQFITWSVSFVCFAILCGLLGYKNSLLSSSAVVTVDAPTSNSETLADAVATRPAIADRLLWFFLPACAAMLLCSVTNHLSQNVAAIPLLWILPLIAYLLSFIVTFSANAPYPRTLVLRLLALALGSLAYGLYDARYSLPIRIAIPVFCAGLFFACWFCHGELYRLRPTPQHATTFYLLLSAGAAAGAMLAAVVAPAVFSGTYELASALAATAAVAVAVTWRNGVEPILFWSAVTICMILVLAIQVRDYRRDAIVQVRGFYGTLRVTETHMPPGAGTSRILYHGTIRHGMQMYGPGLRGQPTTYYAYDSGIGLALQYCCTSRSRRVGVIGLGTGTLAAYGRTGDVFHFYEIDPLVEGIARHFFTFLADSAATITVSLGDARLLLEGESPEHFDVLAVDAFSGDAVPTHLLTAEAFQLYLRHLQPKGILALHISSLYLDLAPVVLQQARHAGLHAALIHSRQDDFHGEFTADWVLVTTNQDFLSNPKITAASEPIAPQAGLRLWTDDYSSLLPILK